MDKDPTSEEVTIESYLKTHPEQFLCNPNYRVKYVRSLEEEEMCLFFVKNTNHPNGKWRVSRQDGQICSYFGDSFTEGINKLQTDKNLLQQKLFNDYGS